MSSQTKITYRMLERISHIHRKIKSGCYPNTKQLAYELESGLATISRDLDYMRDRMYAPIEYDFTHKGYYYTEDFEPSMQNHLSDKDLRVMLSAKTLLSHYKNTPIYEEACSMLDLLSSNAMDGKNTALMNRIAVAPTVETNVNQEIWNAIQDSLNQNHILQFDYTDRWGKKTEQRRVRPYQLVLDEGICYLFGFDELRQAERIFSLVRIRNAVVTEDEFELPKNYDFESRCKDGNFGAVFSKKAEHYVIEFYNEARLLVKEKIWADSQVFKEDENKTTIEFDSSQFLKIKSWVLSNGCNAKPIQPEWLVKEWKRHVEGMTKLM
ncbi:MAG: WYL domain-containing protein [Treponema sp.]|uniref:helix-turn-helix transcriptional regulator n=1 Tax=Treponema sp. TaxID=166 RepID=UPI001B296AC1|nr:WYL domain-containing protein [Treponema sp.]MBO5608215.1 WYL domain-containing protein [Treponema sp.]MBQ8680211.1 WYL domain-containing protein [Treponema sp.]MBR1535944.1 WYL domain-containing protein [Treponema sp.]MBR1535959.1 WYL domain-containing protein [Treponema sp.]